MSEQQAAESWRGQVGRMNEAQVEAFLKEGRVCRLACLDDEGWPYVVPVWFHYADGKPTGESNRARTRAASPGPELILG